MLQIFLVLLVAGFKISNGLPADTVSEGGCIVPKNLVPVPPQLVEKNKSEQYIVLGSKFFFHTIGEIFLRRAVSRSEVDKTCFRITMYTHTKDLSYFEAKFHAFGNSFNDSCKAKQGVVDCTITYVNRGVDTSLYKTGKHYILASDNKTYTLIYNCILDEFGRGFGNYKVLATKPIPLPPKLKNEYVNIIKSLGFKEKHIMVPSLESCVEEFEVDHPKINEARRLTHSPHQHPTYHQPHGYLIRPPFIQLVAYPIVSD